VPDSRRRRGYRTDRNGGFTIIEMVISMSLLTVVLTFCMVAIVSLQRSVTIADARTQAVDQARLAVQQIDRQIRSGNIFYNPSCPTITIACPVNFNGMGLVIFTQANGNQRCVEWQVTASGTLQSRSWTQTWQTDGSPSVVHWATTATGVTNYTSNKAAFVLDSSYGGRVLNIDITTDVTSSQSHGSEITDSVEGRNTEYGYSANSCSTPWPATS
jgi:prepilin-type N-terminal cleavage/methylation domain-containing protein